MQRIGVRLAIRLRDCGFVIPESVTSAEALAEAIFANLGRGERADA